MKLYHHGFIRLSIMSNLSSIFGEKAFELNFLLSGGVRSPKLNKRSSAFASLPIVVPSITISFALSKGFAHLCFPESFFLFLLHLHTSSTGNQVCRDSLTVNNNQVTVDFQNRIPCCPIKLIRIASTVKHSN